MPEFVISYPCVVKSTYRIRSRRRWRSTAMLLCFLGSTFTCRSFLVTTPIHSFHHRRQVKSCNIPSSNTCHSATAPSKARTTSRVVTERISTTSYVSFNNTRGVGLVEAPSADQDQSTLVSDKIAALLNNQISDDSDLFGDIADRQTVFSKLTDDEKNEVSFSLSTTKVHDVSESILEPAHLAATSHRKNNGRKAASKRERKEGGKEDVSAVNPNQQTRKKRRIRANVLETGEGSMKQYFKSMGQYQVLSKEDEIILGKQIQILNKWEEKRQLLEEKLLRAPTFDEWAEAVDVTVTELKAQIRRSQKAKQALIQANLRLVVTLARRTVSKWGSEINFQDACQEGILGLVRASEKFDVDRGFRFSSYAGWWIKKMIHVSVTDQSRPVRLPARVMTKINKIRIAEKSLEYELGRHPKPLEVSERVGMTIDEIKFYKKSAESVTSLDKSVKHMKTGGSESSETELHCVIKDPDGQSPAESMNKQMFKEDVRRLIGTLSPKEQVVIRLRFGLDNGKQPQSLAAIAKKFSVSREAIQRIEKKALIKLRQPYRNKSLQAYVSDSDFH